MKKVINAITSLFKGSRDAGMAIAEYVIGIAVIVALGGVVFKIITDPTFAEMVKQVVSWIFGLITSVGR